MGSYAIIGAHLPVAAGAAWRAQYRGTEQVAVCFFGDGTTNIGAFHEALNFAVVWKLPVVFVCENNLYMEYTPIRTVTAVEHPAADRAGAYGLERVVIDGNDADEVYPRPREVHGPRARKGGGPALIEADDLPPQRPLARRPGQVPARRRAREAGCERDPITLYRERLLELGVSEATLEDMEGEAMRKVDEATEIAKAIAAAVARRASRRTCGRTEARHGGTDLSRRGRGGHRAGDGARRARRVPGRGRRRGGRRVQDDGGAAREIRPEARARLPDLRAGDPRRGDGRRDDGTCGRSPRSCSRTSSRCAGTSSRTRSPRRAT